VAIWCLTFVVLGVFAMGLTPQAGHAYLLAHKIPLRIDRNPTPVNLTQFKNGYASVIVRSNGPLRVGGSVQAPRLIRKVEALYPALAKATRTQGTVVLDCVIDERGNVTQMKLVSGHPLLVQAALAAVQQWKYQPTLLNGMPVAVEMHVTVNFVLGGS